MIIEITDDNLGYHWWSFLLLKMQREGSVWNEWSLRLWNIEIQNTRINLKAVPDINNKTNSIIPMWHQPVLTRAGRQCCDPNEAILVSI